VDIALRCHTTKRRRQAAHDFIGPPNTRNDAKGDEVLVAFLSADAAVASLREACYLLSRHCAYFAGYPSLICVDALPGVSYNCRRNDENTVSQPAFL
jgi:hypothetical protein